MTRPTSSWWSGARSLVLAALGLASGLPMARGADPESPAAAAATIEYNRDIRPILNENCFACHGADSAARKADLRLDRRDDAIKAEAIVPGATDKSAMVERIFSVDKDEVMPPPSAKKTLTNAQKELLSRWIANGAEYQPHWSFIAPKKVAPPAVKNENWVRNPIDRFILAKLEAKGLTPAPEADRHTLVRRLSLDLTGLPPTPEIVDAFLADKSPDAYEKLVDRLIASDRWGEHRGRYWLDAARYADTHGIHIDNYREMWAYRDWVINAFNRNVPFDTFTIEQLAGDLLPNRTLEQQVASGFNRCNITTSEGGAIDEEYLVLYARDRTETTSQVWMGLTTGCAVCHDHKFDPISQKEFYSLSAFFNNTTQAAMDGNIKDTPPIVFVPRAEDRPRWDALNKDIEVARAAVEGRRKTARADFDREFAAPRNDLNASSAGIDGLQWLAPLSEGEGSSVLLKNASGSRQVDLGKEAAWESGQVADKALAIKPGVNLDIPEAGDFERDQPFSYGAWVKIPKEGGNGPVFARMDEGHAFRGWDLWLEGNRPAAHIVSAWPGNALKVSSKLALKPGDWHHLFVTYDGKGQAAGISLYVDGKIQAVDVQANTLKDSIKTAVPLTLGRRFPTTRLPGLVLQDLRVYSRALAGPEVATVALGSRADWIASRPAEKRTEAESKELFDWWLNARDADFKKFAETHLGLEKTKAEMSARGTLTHVMQEKNQAPMAFVLNRGEYDKRKDQVKPETPAILPPMPDDLPKNRLGLAHWLLRGDHPLTARVTVNRFWQELFGTGIVRTTGDFGVTGELPSHPELLDWLAVDFRENGWDIKRVFKMLVTSSAYRQSAATTPEKLEKDPGDRLISRGPRFRMDAEMVRDYALSAAGILASRIGGPSVKPYQPEGVWEAVAMPGSNTRDYRQDSGEGLYRRSLYTFWKRAAPPASMEIFNAPTRETCTVRRERTNTPLQALVTLNDPQFVEAARHLAELTLKAGGSTPEDRAGFLAARLLARPLQAEEAKVVVASLNDLSTYYQGHPAEAKSLITFGDSKPEAGLDPRDVAAWTMLANEMMNLDEVLNK